MTSLLAWLITSRPGRFVASALVGIMIVASIAMAFFMKGKRAGKSRQQREALKRLRNRIRIDEDIRRMSRADRRKRLSDDWGQ